MSECDFMTVMVGGGEEAGRHGAAKSLELIHKVEAERDGKEKPK